MIGRFVVWAAVGALTVPFAAAAQPQDAASAPLKIEDFTRDPALSQPKISPDGTHLAWIEDNTLYIFDTRDQTAKHASGGKYPMAGLDWIDNDDLAVYPEQLTRKQLIARPKYRFSPLVVSKEARIVRPLMARPDGKVWPEDMTPIVRYVTTPVPATVTFTDERVYTVEVATGKRTVTATLIRGDWHFFDAKGTERVAVDFNDSKVSYGFTGATVRYRDASGTVQTLKLPRQDKDNIYYTDFDYAADDNGLYWSQFDYKAGIASIYRFDLATGAKTLFRTTAEKNTGIVLNAKGKVVGVSTESDRLHVDWTDPYYKTMMEAVQKLFPEAEVAITDMSDDGGKVVFLISGPQQPDTYYIYDAQSRHLDEIGTNYPELEGQVLAPLVFRRTVARRPGHPGLCHQVQGHAGGCPADRAGSRRSGGARRLRLRLPGPVLRASGLCGAATAISRLAGIRRRLRTRRQPAPGPDDDGPGGWRALPGRPAHDRSGQGLRGRLVVGRLSRPGGAGLRAGHLCLRHFRRRRLGPDRIDQ